MMGGKVLLTLITSQAVLDVVMNPPRPGEPSYALFKQVKMPSLYVFFNYSK